MPHVRGARGAVEIAPVHDRPANPVRDLPQAVECPVCPRKTGLVLAATTFVQATFVQLTAPGPTASIQLQAARHSPEC
jgi:hypothetical protein